MQTKITRNWAIAGAVAAMLAASPSLSALKTLLHRRAPMPAPAAPMPATAMP